MPHEIDRKPERVLLVRAPDLLEDDPHADSGPVLKDHDGSPLLHGFETDLGGSGLSAVRQGDFDHRAPRFEVAPLAIARFRHDDATTPDDTCATGRVKLLLAPGVLRGAARRRGAPGGLRVDFFLGDSGRGA